MGWNLRGRSTGLLTVVITLAACAPAAAPSASPPGGPAGSAPASPAGSPSATTAQAAAEAAACAAIQTWSDEMRALVALDPATASIEDVAAQRDRIEEAWTGVRASLEDVDAADEDAVVEAARSLEAALRDFSTDVPVEQAIDELEQAAEPLRASYQQMADGLGCELESPY